MTKRLVLATDIGTTSVRSMIYDADGTVFARSQGLYPTLRPQPFYEEQDPDLVRNEVLQCMKQCVSAATMKGACTADEIKAVSFSSQMYSILAIDNQGRALTNSMLWSDGRAEYEVEEIRKEAGPLGWYQVTGCPPSSIFPIAKIRWIKNTLPEVNKVAVRFLSIKEYMLLAFIDEPVIDYSMASATGLFDIFNHRWSDDAVRTAGISQDQLGRPVSGLEIFPIRKTKVLQELGLKSETVLICGGGDGPLANIGSGAGQVGAVNIDLGTSGAARVITDHAITDENGSLWCFCLTEDRWAYGGILSNVGNAFDWIVRNITDYSGSQGLDMKSSGCKSLSPFAGEVPDGADGLVFLPYLRRARSPYWDNRLQGALLGLHAGHDIRHVVRALIESIGYDLRSILSLMETHTRMLPDIILSGGIARGDHIARILADIIGKPLYIQQDAEASLAGAAIMGLYALGLTDGLDFTNRTEAKGKLVLPQQLVHQRYDSLYETYRHLVMEYPRYMRGLEK